MPQMPDLKCLMTADSTAFEESPRKAAASFEPVSDEWIDAELRYINRLNPSEPSNRCRAALLELQARRRRDQQPCGHPMAMPDKMEVTITESQPDDVPHGIMTSRASAPATTTPAPKFKAGDRVGYKTDAGGLRVGTVAPERSIPGHVIVKFPGGLFAEDLQEKNLELYTVGQAQPAQTEDSKRFTGVARRTSDGWEAVRWIGGNIDRLECWPEMRVVDNMPHAEIGQTVMATPEERRPVQPARTEHVRILLARMPVEWEGPGGMFRGRVAEDRLANPSDFIRVNDVIYPDGDRPGCPWLVEACHLKYSLKDDVIGKSGPTLAEKKAVDQQPPPPTPRPAWSWEPSAPTAAAENPFYKDDLA